MSGSPTRLAVVKRANQGTGLEIVHQLAEEGNSIVLYSLQYNVWYRGH